MFINRGTSQYAILSSVVFTPSFPVTSGSLSFYRLANAAFYRLANVADKLRGGRMNSRGAAALAALTTASALLAYVLFRKKEPKVKELEEVSQVEQEEVVEKVTRNDEPEKTLEEIEKVELAEEVTNNDEPEKRLEEIEKVKSAEEVANIDEPEKRLEEIERVELAEEVTNNDEPEKTLEEIEKVELAEKVTNEDGQEKGLEEECSETDEARRGKESLMEWIDRQLEEAERKTGGSPWPEIPEEDKAGKADGAAVDPKQSSDSQEVGRDLSDVKRDLQEAEKQLQGAELQLEEAERKTGGSPWPEIPEEDESEICHDGDNGAAVDPEESSDSQEVEMRDLSDVKRELQEAEKQLLGAELQLEEAEMCVSSQGDRYEQSREIKRAEDERERTQSTGTSDSLSADYPQQPLDVILEGALNPESNDDSLKAEREEKSIDNSSKGDDIPPSSAKDNNNQFDMSSDSEIELLKEPSKGCEDNETGQLLDETESEGENTEDVTLDVNLKNEDSEPAKMGNGAINDTPDELIVLRPAWQKNLSSKK